MEQNTKPVTLEEAANSYNSNDSTISVLEQRAFKEGALWQKEQDKELARKLIGLESWIADLQMRELFQQVLYKLTS